MKAANIKELKYELKERSQKELLDFCLRLAKFKKENKELLTYLLFESYNEFEYINSVKNEIDTLFEQINKNNYYYIKKSIRKTLSSVRKFTRYSQKKETEVELMIYFLKKMKKFQPSVFRNIALKNLYKRQIETVNKAIISLHEDLQFDYKEELNDLKVY